MKPILQILEKLGFTDTRTGITNNHNNTSGIQPDIVAHTGMPRYPHHVFAFDTGVKKTFASSASLKNPNISPRRNEWLRRVRSEIRQIIEQCSNPEQAAPGA